MPVMKNALEKDWEPADQRVCLRTNGRKSSNSKGLNKREQSGSMFTIKIDVWVSKHA